MKEGQEYTVGTWFNKPNYCCTACSFSNPSLPEMRRHWRTLHKRQARRSVRVEQSKILGSDGQPFELEFVNVPEPPQESDDDGR